MNKVALGYKKILGRFFMSLKHYHKSRLNLLNRWG